MIYNNYLYVRLARVGGREKATNIKSKSKSKANKEKNLGKLFQTILFV